MAELGTLARPYAKAAFEYAISKNALGPWFEHLSLASQIAQAEAVQQVLSDPSITAEQQASLFGDICGEQVSAEFKNLITSLADNGRLELLPDILEQYKTLKEDHEKTIDVEIRTAFPLEAATEQRLVEALKNKLAREIKAQTIVDETLIGGVLIRAGDIVIDGSAKGRLAKLSETMSAKT